MNPDLQLGLSNSLLAYYDHHTLSPGVSNASVYRFNSSLMAWRTGYIMAYRAGWAGSDIYITRLDDDLLPITCSTVFLDLRGKGAGSGCEDPRLFMHNGIPHVAFAGVEITGNEQHTNVLYARLNPNTLVPEEVFFPQYAGRQKWEKNWSFFEHDGSLHAVYSIKHHRILRIDGKKASLVAEETNSMPWIGGTPRGGASPVRVGDEFWHFFHDHVKVGNKRVYRTGLYTFDAFPPFRPRRLIPRPILVADTLTKSSNRHCSVVFPCGAVHENDRWIVSHGVEDRWTELHEWAHGDLDSRLEVIK